jgi:hypothetical protein
VATTGQTLIARNRGKSSVQVTLKNKTGTQVVTLGGSDVTASTGYEWAATGENGLPVRLEPGDELYGVATTAAQTIHVLRSEAVA